MMIGAVLDPSSHAHRWMFHEPVFITQPLSKTAISPILQYNRP
jgi:hypothetical protein